MIKIKPQRIRRGFTVQQREKSNEPFVDMFELGFCVPLLFFCFSDYFNFAD